GIRLGTVSRLCYGDRFDVSDQRVDLLFAYESLKCWHDRLKAFHALRARIEDAFAEIVFVGIHGATVFELNRLPEDALQIRPASLGIAAMAGGAAEFGENFLSRRGEWTSGTAVHPRFILRWLLDDDRADHARVLGTAIFCAEQVIHPRLGRAEPFHRVAPGQHILLDAERRNIEAVDHILRSHDELDVASHRDMQFVDLALTFGVLHLPHPLLRHNVNFSRVGGWRALFEVNDGAPGKDHHKDEKRNRAPGDFQSS